MKPLFSDTGLRVTESLSFTRSAYAFDFDGTLAPIVENPEHASASPRVVEHLRKLSRLVPVIVISGRSVSDLRSRLPLKSVHMIGNHGLEGIVPSSRTTHPALLACRRWVSQLGGREDLRPIGVVLENKTYSVALHYRGSRRKRAARAAIFRAAESLRPSPRLVSGKCVVNLIPPGAPHKGVALLEAMIHLGATSALYIGDDDTDEDVFSLPDPRIISVRVGGKKSSQAQFYLNRQRDVLRLIERLIANEIKKEKS